MARRVSHVLRPTWTGMWPCSVWFFKFFCFFFKLKSIYNIVLVSAVHQHGSTMFFFFNVDDLIVFIELCYNSASVLWFGLFSQETYGVLAPRPGVEFTPLRWEAKS